MSWPYYPPVAGPPEDWDADEATERVHAQALERMGEALEVGWPWQ